MTAADAQRVYRIVRNLRERGLAVIYISHRMHEIEELADTCTVLRGGRLIATFKSGERRPEEILQMMIGRDISRSLSTEAARRPLPRQPCSKLRACPGPTGSPT